MLATVPALRRLKARPRKPSGGGVVFALAMILASVFDSARAAAIEQLDRRKDIEGSEDGESGARPA
jgi:hypothetical protein